MADFEQILFGRLRIDPDPSSCAAGAAALLLWIGHEVENVVSIVLDGEIKTPPTINPRLPDVTTFTILLCPQGTMAATLLKQGEFLVKELLISVEALT